MITSKNKIEFGLNIMDDGAFNDVFTGHREQELKGFNDVFLMRLEQGHTFKDIDHSHQRTTMPSPSDKKSAKWVYQQLAGKQKNMPTMNVFESWGGRYYKYYPLSNRLTKNRRK